MSHKSSTALRYTGTGADFVGFRTLQGVDPASPPHRLETRTSTRSPFARDEFCETCGLGPYRRLFYGNPEETGIPVYGYHSVCFSGVCHDTGIHQGPVGLGQRVAEVDAVAFSIHATPA